MKVIAEGDLRELLTEGKNRRYRNIVRNKELFDGLKRAVNYMIAAENIESLKLIEIDDTHYGNKK